MLFDTKIRKLFIRLLMFNMMGTEIQELRLEVMRLREVVEATYLLLHKKLMKELLHEKANIEKGDYYTEAEFIKRHSLKIQ